MGACKNWVELDYNCEPIKYCAQCAKLADAPRTPCLCGNNCKGFCPLEVEMEELASGKTGTLPIAVGKGFDVEEAE
jgi:hypothetical protein